MGIFDGCLLASDVDGTLIENDVIHPRVLEKIRYFTDEGGIFALSTGRSLGAVSAVLEKVEGIGPSVVCNGCMIYDYAQKKILFQITESQMVKDLVSYIYQNLPQVGIELHCEEKVLVLRRNAEIADHERYERLDSADITLEEALKLKWNKALLAVENATDIDVFLSLAKPEQDFLPAHTTAFIDGRARHYCELLPKGINKAVSTQKLCELLNIKKGGFFAIGDYYNDEEMVLAADVGAITKNAPEDLRQKADYISETVENGAVADFIDYLETVVQTR
ncbi:MAG: HAD family hydrolase [Clostridia bacterium]|nr:HAD family hydrolase [Clostridia bacterium]